MFSYFPFLSGCRDKTVGSCVDGFSTGSSVARTRPYIFSYTAASRHLQVERTGCKLSAVYRRVLLGEMNHLLVVTGNREPS